VNRRVLPVWIAALVFAFDRITKVWIERSVEQWQSITVIPGFFDIVHAKNKGAAFGMFADSDHPLRTFLLIGVSLGVLMFVSYLLLRPGRAGFVASPFTTAGLSLVLGGALGNIYDRVAHGEVTDFLEFYSGSWRFAAFNVADSAISVGAALLILDMWITRKDTHAAKAD
jgi:signal peptidase II